MSLSKRWAKDGQVFLRIQRISASDIGDLKIYHLGPDDEHFQLLQKSPNPATN
jgi:hypothetical protein